MKTGRKGGPCSALPLAASTASAPGLQAATVTPVPAGPWGCPSPMALRILFLPLALSELGVTTPAELGLSLRVPLTL